MIGISVIAVNVAVCLVVVEGIESEYIFVKHLQIHDKFTTMAHIRHFLFLLSFETFFLGFHLGEFAMTEKLLSEKVFTWV